MDLDVTVFNLGLGFNEMENRQSQPNIGTTFLTDEDEVFSPRKSSFSPRGSSPSLSLNRLNEINEPVPSFSNPSPLSFHSALQQGWINCGSPGT